MLPGISPVKALMPFMRTPPPDLITKAPPPGTITLGVRFQRAEMWRMGVRQVHKKFYSPGAGRILWTDTRCVLRGSQMLLR